jgi:hypothetical protein
MTWKREAVVVMVNGGKSGGHLGVMIFAAV